MSRNYLAQVKAVLSSDTLVLSPPSKGVPTDTERTLNLAFVSGPRLGKNEPFSFEAREFLRKFLLGKPIQFKVLYKVGDREYGDVFVPGVFSSLIEKCLTDGLVKIRDDATNKDSFDQYAETLPAAEAKAKNAGKGVWSTKFESIELQTDTPTLDQTYNGIVERVVSGDRVTLRVPLKGGKAHFLRDVLIAGIRAPRSASPDVEAEPYGQQSKIFVASKILQRSVKATFVGESSSGLPIAIIESPDGNVAQLTVAQGLATVSDWQGQYLGATRMAVLRKAEESAKANKSYLWKDYNTEAKKSLKGYDAVVAKVISADTLVVRLPNDQERTVQLASIRAPRRSDPLQEPFVAPAREFVRSKYIGKKVLVTVQAIRPKSDQFDEREIVSVVLAQRDISLNIVEKGCATVIRYKKGDDQDKSPVWDELIEKEADSVAKSFGMHSKKVPSPLRIVNASESVTKARSFLPLLQRHGRIPAVVEHIGSGSRFILNVPRENSNLALVLSGVRVPKTNEEGGEDALLYVNKHLLQRDVQFTVIGVDKIGSFIGHVYPSAKDDTPISLTLVKEGLASVNEYSAYESGFNDELVELEQEAKSAKKGIWRDYSEETAVEEKGEYAPAARPQNYFDVTIPYISDAGEIFYRELSREESYKKLQGQVSSHCLAAGTNSASLGAIKKGTVVAAKLDEAKFARAKVTFVEKGTGYVTVYLIDSGETQRVQVSSLRSLSPSLAEVTPFARSATLSFVKIPKSGYDRDDCIHYIKSLALRRELVTNLDHSGNEPSITLYSGESKGVDDSLNTQIVASGYAFFNEHPWARTEVWSSLVSSLQGLELTAKSERIGVWEYGDSRDDDE